MKLYTEEQVKQMIDRVHNGYDGYYDVMSPFAPIELPTDDEIETKIENMEGISLEIEVGYRAGARWMRNKIINR